MPREKIITTRSETSAEKTARLELNCFKAEVFLNKNYRRMGRKKIKVGYMEGQV